MSEENTQNEKPTSNGNDELLDADVLLLASLGYKQGKPTPNPEIAIAVLNGIAELRRHFSPLQIFGTAFSIVGLVSAFS